jgi:hypothetical protein
MSNEGFNTVRSKATPLPFRLITVTASRIPPDEAAILNALGRDPKLEFKILLWMNRDGDGGPDG